MYRMVRSFRAEGDIGSALGTAQERCDLVGTSEFIFDRERIGRV